MAEFRMPSLGADMDAGTLVEWLKRPGERVARGDTIAVVETQKGAIEIEVFEDGVLQEVKVHEGEQVPVGTVLALIHDETEWTPAPPATAAEPRLAAVREGVAAGVAAGAAPPSPAPRVAAPAPAPAGARLRISPVARRRAAELGVDAAKLRGTGPGGAISLRDVEAATAAAPAAPAPAPLPRPGRIDLGEMRRAIGAAMARAKREIPHYYLGTTVDLTRMTEWLEEENARRPVTERMLYVVPLLKGVALALREVPELNGFWADGGFRPSAAIHLGAAIALRGGGLIAPALHDADRAPLDELMRRLRDLVRRARSGGLRSSELSDPTVTVTSLGEGTVETVYPVIYPPQVAIVGFGALVTRPWTVDGELRPRRVIRATLAADHRASDGHRGARFLTTLDGLLQEPEKL